MKKIHSTSFSSHRKARRAVPRALYIGSLALTALPHSHRASTSFRRPALPLASSPSTQAIMSSSELCPVYAPFFGAMVSLFHIPLLGDLARSHRHLLGLHGRHLSDLCVSLYFIGRARLMTADRHRCQVSSTSRVDRGETRADAFASYGTSKSGVRVHPSYQPVPAQIMHRSVFRRWASCDLTSS